MQDKHIFKQTLWRQQNCASEICHMGAKSLPLHQDMPVTLILHHVYQQMCYKQYPKINVEELLNFMKTCPEITRYPEISHKKQTQDIQNMKRNGND
jgi:hypothetical protein